MQKLSPSQVRKPPLTPTSYEGANVEAGFLAKCLPFAVGGSLTVAVVVFDLVTDWLAYAQLSRLEFTVRVQSTDEYDREAFWGMNSFFRKIPMVYLALCIISSLVCVVDASRWVLLISTQRKRFKEKVDGLSYKENMFEKYGGEVILVFQTIIHDLAISCLVLAVQAAIGCSFVLHLSSAVFGISVIATCVSVIWKIGLVIWNAGCLGRRERYKQNVVVSIVRILTFLLLALTLAIVILNLLILRNQKYQGRVLHNTLFDKIGMDRWIDEDYLVLMIKSKHYRAASHDQKVSSGIVEIFHYGNIVRLKDVIDNPLDQNKTLQVNVSCDSLHEANKLIDVREFFQKEHQISHDLIDDCSVMFRLSFSAAHSSVIYNQLYTYKDLRTDTCIYGNFREIGEVANDTDTGSDENSNVSNSLTSSPLSNDGFPANTTIAPYYKDPKNPSKVWYLKLEYRSSVEDPRWVRCMFDIKTNATLLPLTPCSLPAVTVVR